MKKIQRISLNDVTFVTIVSNRDVKVGNLGKEIKGWGGVASPPIVFPVQELEGEGHQYINVVTRIRVEHIPENCYVVADGQRRIVAVDNINKEAEARKDDIIENGDSEDAMVFNIKELDVCICDKKELHGKSLSQFIVLLNNNSASWKPNDFVHLAATTCPEEDVTHAITAMSGAGFSISAISRYFAFQGNRINNAVLEKFSHGDKHSLDVNYRRGVAVVRTLHELGFSASFLKKRYLADYIGESQKHSDNRFNLTIQKITALDKEAIRRIEELPKDKNKKLNEIIDAISDIVDERYQSFEVHDVYGTTLESVNIHEDDFEGNINAIRSMKPVRVIKTRKH